MKVSMRVRLSLFWGKGFGNSEQFTSILFIVFIHAQQ